MSFSLDKDSNLQQTVALKLSENNRLNYGYFATHRGENSKSDIKMYGSMDDQAQKSSELKIHFLKGCVGAFGSEIERISLFGKQNSNIAIPTIFSDESEAQGRHSFSSGRISEEELNYLQARGLPKNSIKRILSDGELLKVAKMTKSDEIIAELS